MISFWLMKKQAKNTKEEDTQQTNFLQPGN